MKPAKIQHICEFELDRIGCCRSEFRHRKGIVGFRIRTGPSRWKVPALVFLRFAAAHGERVCS